MSPEHMVQDQVRWCCSWLSLQPTPPPPPLDFKHYLISLAVKYQYTAIHNTQLQSCETQGSYSVIMWLNVAVLKLHSDSGSSTLLKVAMWAITWVWQRPSCPSLARWGHHHIRDRVEPKEMISASRTAHIYSSSGLGLDPNAQGCILIFAFTWHEIF